MEGKGQNQLTGTVSHVIFQNKENGYTVLRLKTGQEEVIAVGILPQVTQGEQVILEGSWTDHPNFGRQFKAERAQRQMPSEKQGIYRYLASGVIKGIGPKLAERLVKEFGEETFSVLESQPERLAQMKGVSRKRALEIQGEFLQKAGMRVLMEFLTGAGLPVELGLKLWRSYGQGAVDLLRADPYILTDPEYGVDFQKADHMAASIGVDWDDPQRIQAGLLYTLTHNLDLGHVFLPMDKLLAAASRLLSNGAEHIPSDLLAEGLEALEFQERVVCEHIAGVDAVYRQDLYEAEQYIAWRVTEMCQQELHPPEGIPELVAQVEQEQGVQYAEQQREAVELAGRVQLMLLTGGPGTGKTTSLRGILGLFEAMGLETALAAPTGRAAKRLSELCGTEATTIHRLLGAGYDPERGQLAFSKDEEELLDAQAIIVDEVSMVDISLMAALLRAMKNECRLVLVGDPDQLPSVGPGRLFDHLIRSGIVPVVRLTEIFRQAQQSAIIRNAHLVNQGILPGLDNKNKDFFFLRRLQPERTAQTIVELCQTRLPKNMGIPADQIQVLSPTRKYATGTTQLNTMLQAALNPPTAEKRERKRGSVVFREGDRVMQVKNNYDIMWREADGLKGGMGVFNGDIGVITEIQPDAGLLTVNFDGRLVEYTGDMLVELELAYAMTVHKAQGSEYRAVILAVNSGAPMLLTRGVLYTAITRAKELFLIVGDENIVTAMVANDRQARRYSGLRARLMNGGGENPLRSKRVLDLLQEQEPETENPWA